MKNLLFVTILSLSISAFTGCGETATNTAANTTAVNKTAADNAMTKTSPAAEAPKTDLKPADVDPNKPVPVAELKAAYLADKAAWHGKQVSVAGNYFGKGKTTKGGKDSDFYVSISDESKKLMGTCYLENEASDEVGKQPENHTFKGTIVEDKGGLVPQVVLKPCEIVK